MKYRKKPVVIEAVQWDGNNTHEIAKFMNDDVLTCEAFVNGLWAKAIEIKTLEGTMKASVGDFIIKGINGEFYPCKPDIFEKTYEKVTDNDT